MSQEKGKRIAVIGLVCGLAIAVTFVIVLPTLSNKFVAGVLEVGNLAISATIIWCSGDDFFEGLGGGYCFLTGLAGLPYVIVSTVYQTYLLLKHR